MNNNYTLDEDWFKFNVTAGKTYRFTMSGYKDRFMDTTLLISGFEPGADMTDKYGYSISYNMDNNNGEYLDFTPSTSGTYYIKIWNFFNSSSVNLSSTDYSIQVKQVG